MHTAVSQHHYTCKRPTQGRLFGDCAQKKRHIDHPHPTGCVVKRTWPLCPRSPLLAPLTLPPCLAAHRGQRGCQSRPRLSVPTRLPSACQAAQTRVVRHPARPWGSCPLPAPDQTAGVAALAPLATCRCPMHWTAWQARQPPAAHAAAVSLAWTQPLRRPRPPPAPPWTACALLLTVLRRGRGPG